MAKPKGNQAMPQLFKQMERDIRSRRDGMSEALRDAFLEEGYNMGAQMEHYISTRPSKKSGKEGRIETGAMLSSVDVEDKQTKTRTNVRVGYMGNPKWYMMYQEKGFQHNMSNEWIDGTFAMADAYRNMRARLNRKIRKLGFRSTKY